MNEKLSSKSMKQHDSAELVDSVKDFVNVDVKGRAHVPGGSGKSSGNFLSNHELEMTAAHKDQIENGLEARTADYIVNRLISHNGENELTDPAEVRDALVVGLDDLDLEDYSDEEIMQFVDDKRRELAEYNSGTVVGKETSSVEVGTSSPEIEQLKAENAELRAELAEMRKAIAELTAALRGEAPTQSFDVDAETEAAKARLGADAEAKAKAVIDEIHSSDQAKADKALLDAKKSEKSSDDEFDQNDMDELRKKLDAEDTAEEYKPKHRAEFADEDTPLYDAVKNDLGQSEEVARENESQEEFEPRQPGRHSSAADRMRVIAGGGSSSDSEPSAADRMRQIANGSGEDSSEETTPRRGRLRRLHDIATPTGASAAATAWAANREYKRSNAEQSRGSRARKLGWLAAGLAAGGVITYLRFRGHDVPHGGTHGTVTPGDVLDNLPADGTGTEGVPPAGGAHEIIKSIRVNPGDGEIKVTQHLLQHYGLNVSVEDAKRIGEHANVDLLLGDHNYDDAQSQLDRIGAAPGRFTFRPGSVEKVLAAADELGFKKY